MRVPEDEERVAEASALRAQVDVLRRQTRHPSDFGPWKPDAFYYLFSATASLLVSLLLVASSLSLPGVVAGALCIGLLCSAPVVVNRIRFWWLYRRWNRRLQRRIASLDVEIKRLQNGH